jgi:hypothetical protein
MGSAKLMRREVEVDFKVALENAVCGAGDPPFRNGLPLRGNGRPIRDASPWARRTRIAAAGLSIRVSWAPEVFWQGSIRVSNP